MAGQGPRLKVGTVVNVHVIAKQGDYHTVLKDDQWTVTGVAGEPSVLFTAMVLITPQGQQVLTPMLAGADAEPAPHTEASQGPVRKRQ